MVDGNAWIRKRTLVLILPLAVFTALMYIYNFTETKPAHSYFFEDKSYPFSCAKKNTTVPSIKSTNFTLVIAVQVHNRDAYLKELLRSLSKNPDITKALLIFSHDYFDDDINALINNNTFCMYKQIFYPYATNSTSPTKVSQTKLHWWWKANEVFKIAAHYRYDDLVLFLEEDHFVAEDFSHILRLLQDVSEKHCSNCVYSLGDGTGKFKTKNNKFKTSNRMSNMGLAFNATTWSTISACADSFCKYNDYNWDWSLNYIFQECVQPQPKTLIMSGNRVFHVGRCGLHFNDDDCDATKLIKDIQEEISKYSVLLYPERLEYIGKTTTNRITKAFGGFKEKEDQELCLCFTSSEPALSANVGFIESIPIS